MSPSLILSAFLLYTILLFAVAWYTSRRAGNEAFYIGNRQSLWYVVAYGMIGASLSVVTFISIPGDVVNTKFSYMMIVFGYLLGYVIIANVLLPLYYRHNLTSIYAYLNGRFGFSSYKTGASFFLLSRTVGASVRIFLVVNVLHIFVFGPWGVPFWLTSTLFIILIWLYTFRGGVKTIVWTDTLQTTFMLGAIILTIILISRDLDISFTGLLGKVAASDYSRIFFTDWHHRHFFLKDFFAGAFIAVVMTGLDQEMMQKNLSCKNLKESQKNMYWMSGSLVLVNLMILTLGAILYIFADSRGIAVPDKTDYLFPTLALEYLGPAAGIVFVIGLISAAYPSADGALTALTTIFCVDILGIERKAGLDTARKVRIRHTVHAAMTSLFIFLIVGFRAINDESVIQELFTIAGYTYGPLLGLYAFGLFTRRAVNDRCVPLVAVASPVICYFLSIYDKIILNGYNFGFELLIINGLVTFTGLALISRKTGLTQPI
jgi:Na+/proline symporter